MNKHLKLVINNSHINNKQVYFFEKDELKIILDLYAKMVSNGSWKDYGLKISSKQVAFSVFKKAGGKLWKIFVGINLVGEKVKTLIRLVLFDPGVEDGNIVNGLVF